MRFAVPGAQRVHRDRDRDGAAPVVDRLHRQGDPLGGGRGPGLVGIRPVVRNALTDGRPGADEEDRALTPASAAQHQATGMLMVVFGLSASQAGQLLAMLG